MTHACAAQHAAIKADPARFASETANRRPWPAMGLELGDCRGCGSTLALVVDRAAFEGETEAA